MPVLVTERAVGRLREDARGRQPAEPRVRLVEQRVRGWPVERAAAVRRNVGEQAGDQQLRAREGLGRPKRRELAHGFLWEYSTLIHVRIES